MGGPEVLAHRRLAIPEATAGTAVVRVRAFGLNHAGVYFRAGAWGEVAKVSGIECAGEIADPPRGRVLHTRGVARASYPYPLPGADLALS